MKQFDSIRVRILTGLTVLGLANVCGALFSAYAFRTIRRTEADQLETVQRSGEVSAGIVASVFQQLNAGQQYLVTPATSLRAEFRDAADRSFDFSRELERIPALTVSQRLTVNRIKQLQASIEVGYALSHALRDIGREDAARTAAAAVLQPAAELTRLVRSLAAELAQRARRAEQRLTAETARWEVYLYLGLAVALVAASLAGFWTLQSVEGPLVRIIRAAERLGSGDLRPVATVRMPREVEVLAQTMGRLGERLGGIVTEVVGESDRITGSARDLSSISEELAASAGEVATAMAEMSQGANGQRTELDAIGSGLHELRRAATEMATAAERLATLGQEIATVANRHRSNVAAAAGVLLDVREVVQTTSAQVSQLAQQTAAIDDFVDLIRRISSQTNLLALNAAIEAARAGEHGRGFAIVAEEVRQLADESARAAEDVTHTTEAIRDQVEEVTATMAVGTAKVRGIEDVAGGAARGLAEIVAAVEDIEEAAAAVAKAAQDNRVVTERLQDRAQQVSGRAVAHATSAQQVSAAAQEQGASTEQMAATAGSLLQAAEKLRSVVQGLRV